MAKERTGIVEPEALGLVPSDEHELVRIACSIAISLKRIADALQPVEITTSMDITVPPDIRTPPG